MITNNVIETLLHLITDNKNKKKEKYLVQLPLIYIMHQLG